MKWIQFLPPVFSIYLLLISGVTSSHVKNKIHDFVSNKGTLQENEPVIQFLTLDWSARLSFFNSMFVAMISVYPIWLNRSYELLAATSIIILVIFIPMMWWITGLRPDALPATYIRRPRIKYATFCRIVLIIVNLILIAAIAYSQLSSTPETTR